MLRAVPKRSISKIQPFETQKVQLPRESVPRFNFLKIATERACRRKGFLSFQFVVTLEIAAVGVSSLKPHM